MAITSSASITLERNSRNSSRHNARSSINSTRLSRGSSTSIIHSQRLEPPRMVINKMVLNNFKSYFGKQEIGPFHKV